MFTRLVSSGYKFHGKRLSKFRWSVMRIIPQSCSPYFMQQSCSEPDINTGSARRHFSGHPTRAVTLFCSVRSIFQELNVPVYWFPGCPPWQSKRHCFGCAPRLAEWYQLNTAGSIICCRMGNNYFFPSIFGNKNTKTCQVRDMVHAWFSHKLKVFSWVSETYLHIVSCSLEF